MANAMYTSGINGIIDGTIDWTTDTIHAVMVDSGYTFSAGHGTMEVANVPSGNRISTSSALASKTKTSGALDAANLTFSSVAGGSTIDAIIVFKYVTSETNASSIPICYIDTTSDASLPKATNGGDITFSWNANGIVTAS